MMVVMATTPYEVVNGVYLDTRTYMTITNMYLDWCYFNKVDDETASTEDINKFIRDVRSLVNKDVDTIKAALYKYFSYINREYIVI